MKKIRNWLLVILLVSLLLAAGQTLTPVDAAGTIRHVVPGGLNSGTCLTWAKACNLQRALSVVAISGDQIWVKQGTYKPTSTSNRKISFVLKKHVSIYGGFSGTETLRSQRNPKTHVTILSGDIGTPGVISDNSYHVLLGAGTDITALLDGFTITGGNANSIFDPDFLGGGMYNSGSGPILTNVIFKKNSASSGGGGMANISSNPILTNITFSANSTLSSGGGIYNASSSNPTLTKVSFSSNSAVYGGGIYNVGSSPNVINSTFTGNTASSTGGGISDYFTSSPTLTNVTFSNNSAALNGGGMYNINGSNPTLTSVTFNKNSASSNGGGIYNDGSSPALTRTTFSNNTATVYGAGMENYNGSNPSLINITFSHNKAGDSGGGMLNWTSSPILTDVTFDHNSSTAYSGGGILDYFSSPNLTNVTFAGNSAGNSGGGMLNENSSSPTLLNGTFSGNSAAASGDAIANTAGSIPGIYDSVFWNNPTEVYDDGTSHPSIYDSVLSLCPTGAFCLGLINSNPLLAPLASNGGFTQTMALGTGSPAIDAGGQHSTCASKDQRGVKRPQSLACDMGAYEAPVTQNFLPSGSGAQDGWVLESGENTNIGGSFNSTAPTLRLGDNASRMQYRSVLSFDTGDTLPDNAVISSVKISLKFISVTPASTNPISIFHGIMADVKDGFFGTSMNLEKVDFQSSPGKTVGPFSSSLSSGYYNLNLGSSIFPYINKSASLGGLTQIRLRFKLDDNNDSIANILNLGSGEAVPSSNLPVLTVVYTTP